MSQAVLRLPRLGTHQQELLRWIALLTMVIDHIGVLFAPPETYDTFRAVGRIAWPLFAFLLAYNVAVRGVDPRRYLLRLAIFTVVSQLPHTLAFGWKGVSIMGTLFLGALSLSLLERRSAGPLIRILLAVLILLSSGHVEYGLQGVLLVLAFWWALRERTWPALLIAVAAVAFVNWPSRFWPWALLVVPIIWITARLPFGLPRSGLLPWIFYPGHLAILAAIAQLGQ